MVANTDNGNIEKVHYTVIYYTSTLEKKNYWNFKTGSIELFVIIYCLS